MRPSTIVACLLLLSPPPVLACYEHPAEQTGWLNETPSAYRHFAKAGAEASSTLGAWLVAAGSASLAVVMVAFRVLSRARGDGRVGPIEFEPAGAAESSSPAIGPGEVRVRIDPGHDRPEPAGLDRVEEALTNVLVMQ